MYYIKFSKKDSDGKLQHMLFSKKDVHVNQKKLDFIWLKDWLSNKIFFDTEKEANDFIKKNFEEIKKTIVFFADKIKNESITLKDFSVVKINS